MTTILIIAIVSILLGGLNGLNRMWLKPGAITNDVKAYYIFGVGGVTAIVLFCALTLFAVLWGFI